jgi:hypothetical protein
MEESTSTSTSPLENLLQFPIEEDHHVLQISNSSIRARRYSATSSIGNHPPLKILMVETGGTVEIPGKSKNEKPHIISIPYLASRLMNSLGR